MFGGQNKTPFGGASFGTQQAGFGAAATTPFGQSAGSGVGSLFGNKAATPVGFGTPNAFGAQTPGSSLFGTSTAATSTVNTGGLFSNQGSAFGTKPTTSTSGGFNFGGQTQSTGLFGTAGTSGTTGTTGLFATPSTSTAGGAGFGANFGGTAGSGGLFGQTAATAPFGQTGTTPTAGLFGAGGFGANVPTGTTIKFNPPTGTDIMQKSGVSSNINTRHQCITAMKEYESKCLEELRLEDYGANRKGPGTGAGLLGAGGSISQPDASKVGGLFGATATGTTGGLFGQNKTFPAAGTTGYGQTASGSLFGQTAQPQQTSLFASKAGGFGASTGSSLFTGTTGFGQTQQKSLFGQPQASTGLFGATPTTSATGFGATATAPFGQTSAFAQQSQAGSLFKPGTGFPTAAPTSALSFGATAPGSGLFGANKPASGLSLGATATSLAPGFGTTTPAGSLFGKPNTFGTATGLNTSGLMSTGLGAGFGTGTTTSLFGNTPKPTTGLGTFGSTLGSGLGTGFGTGLGVGTTTTSLGTDPNVAVAQQAQLQQQIAALTSSPFGDSPLFRNTLQDSSRKEEILKPTSSAAQKALTTPSHYKLSVRPTAKIKAKPLYSIAGKQQLFDGLDDEDTALSSDIFIPRKNIKKLVIKNSLSPSMAVQRPSIAIEEELIAPQSEYPDETENERRDADVIDIRQTPNDFMKTPRSVNSPLISGENANLDCTISALNVKNKTKSQQPPIQPTQTSDIESSLNETVESHASEDEDEDLDMAPHPAGIVLRRSGYYTIPGMAELAELLNNGDCFVEDFAVGREGYGSVFFPGLTNVANLNLDEIVHIRRKEITLYPDENTKPVTGHGLNKKAEVTLDCTWPNDKTTRKPIKSPNRLKTLSYAEKLEKATMKLGAKFIDYRPETGSWVFQVPHFSKYALEDSDEENDDLPGQDPKKLKTLQQQKLQKEQQQKLKEQEKVLSGEDALQSEEPMKEDRDTDSDMAETTREPLPQLHLRDADDMEQEEPVAHSHRFATSLGMSSHRMQVMKASFFGDEEQMEQVPASGFGSSAYPSTVRSSPAPLDDSRHDKGPEVDTIPFSLFPTKPSYKFSLETTPFNVVIERIQIAPHIDGKNTKVQIQHENSLQVQLEHSMCSILDGCPVFVPEPGVKALHEYCRVADDDIQDDSNGDDSETLQHTSLVFSLCKALWGRLPEDVMAEKGKYTYQKARRDEFSKWLSMAARDRIQTEIQDAKAKDQHMDCIFSQLSGNQISEACEIAQKFKDHRLSLLISQLEGCFDLKYDLQKQLSDWEENGAINFMDESRIRVNTLLAGCPVWISSRGNINTCEMLDWKRALAVHLWFICSKTASISDALKEYEKAFKGRSNFNKYAVSPLPPYLENNPDNDEGEDEHHVIRDTCYHLLKLYSQHAHRMERILAPTTSTPYLLDYRLSWHLYQVLQAIDYTHISEQQSAMLQCNFASHLESIGMWHWAIFVLLHIQDNTRREHSVRNLLCQHCTLSNDEENERKEDLLVNKFRIPREWIHEAKGLRAKYEGCHNDQAVHLLKAGHWNDAHMIIIRHLSADAIINEDFEHLHELLSVLAPGDRSATIQDWNVGGKVFLDYIRISQKLESLKNEGIPNMYDVERLHPEIASLCGRVKHLECHTAKDRLCQSEMAKKTANLMKTVLILQQQSLNPELEPIIPSRLLAPHIGNLPMPEDYALQELRQLTRSYMIEMTS
ncbi:nuclear pore complex protein Nup98-Nup96-like [Saccoglossus kowalevskii]|uniref:Nuclear pore complex protein Nup98-Nup96 n=1 Tax=Saccoglossus kowalevskii TaxID=10224 RepID=A0ABM0MZG1_SACKO|nr:PREDICTED: nuclear pore complex protein Nup98-Nup96-like [Saccoglossus kowalevskii]